MKNLSSKPNFGAALSKKPAGAFAKPGFAMMGGGSKVASSNAPVISKANFNPVGNQLRIGLDRKRQADDNFIENELAQISQSELREPKGSA